METAYRVQAVAVARRIQGGARVVGHKAGVTSAAMQEQMGVDLPPVELRALIRGAGARPALAPVPALCPV